MLANALTTALASIARYAPTASADPEAAPGAAFEATDLGNAGAEPTKGRALGPTEGPTEGRTEVTRLLREAFQACTDFDPIGAEPAAHQLARYLSSEQLVRLSEAIDNLDASAGAAALRELAAALGIELEESAG
ncbi:MAG: hypothetical protein GVY22_06475 [Gammaproteobacteria bacterium]|jgi:hypothetical protein|nr:hypothetical protein [Gammaproteobacteria bacterium]